MTGKSPSSDETEQIWRELNERLRQFIRSRVSSLADVDDILQTVFLAIHQKLDSLRSFDPFRLSTTPLRSAERILLHWELN